MTLFNLGFIALAAARQAARPWALRRAGGFIAATEARTWFGAYAVSTRRARRWLPVRGPGVAAMVLEMLGGWHVRRALLLLRVRAATEARAADASS